MVKIFKIVVLLFSALSVSSFAGGGEIFYGHWVVKRKITSGPVSAYDEVGANKLINKNIYYSSDTAAYEGIVNKTAFYKKVFLSRADFREQTGVDPIKLGITTQPIVEVDVYDDSELSSFWGSVGNVFFVKSKNSLILFSGGVFFELRRK